tara:strand:- start:195933 stop:196127 length:195 start_codon:yes stop_codon:yes gene_type:complete
LGPVYIVALQQIFAGMFPLFGHKIVVGGMAFLSFLDPFKIGLSWGLFAKLELDQFSFSVTICKS